MEWHSLAIRDSRTKLQNVSKDIADSGLGLDRPVGALVVGVTPGLARPEGRY